MSWAKNMEKAKEIVLDLHKDEVKEVWKRLNKEDISPKTKQTNHSQQNKAQKKEGGESNSQCVATPEEMNSTTVTKTADTIQSKIRGSKE